MSWESLDLPKPKLDEVDLQKIRDQEQRDEERNRESRQEGRSFFQKFANYQDTSEAAWRASFIGVLPSAIWVVCACLVSQELNALSRVALAVFSAFSLSLVYVIVPVPCAFLAHIWFGDSRTASVRVASCLAFIATGMTFLWVIRLVR